MTYEVRYTEDKIHIIDGDSAIQISKSSNDERNKKRVQEYITMLESRDFYDSADFTNEFNEHLETVILATRGGGSGAAACRDTLLSLYNGEVYKANISKWYNLSAENRKALLFVLEHQTTSHRKSIDLYLPEYKADFIRMKEEVTDNT